MNCKCGNEIPGKRAELGFKVCINCSTVEKVGCVDVVYHKTGNTIEITDRETAEKIRKLSRRNSKGIMVGMRPSPKSMTYQPSGKVNGQRLLERAVQADPVQFEKDGARALEIMEEQGLHAAQVWLMKRVTDLWLTPVQVGRIRVILEAMQPEPEPVKTSKRNPYSKIEPPAEKPHVDEEISDVFKYWKKF
jgi:hypothetical protein